MKIYTRGGDGGETSLYGGQRVWKDALRVQTYGTVDECNAALGMAISQATDTEIRQVITRIQGELFEVGADLATPLSKGETVPRVRPEETMRLESEIDRFEETLEPLRHFILPDGSPCGASLHLARAICRRAERHLVTLEQNEPINTEVARYLNRLSDHLFVLARLANHRAGTPETIWERPERSILTKGTSTMSELSVGGPAPAFTLPAITRAGETQMSLEDFRDKSSVVLYFYPKDDTPGCTTEACSFRDMLPQFEETGSTVLGISPDDQASHVAFAEKYALPFPLLADPDHAVAEAYGVWKEKTNYGKTYMGIERTTFVIDRSGNVAKIYPRVKVEQHVETVLEFVKALA